MRLVLALSYALVYSMPGFKLQEISALEKFNRESLLSADIDRDGDLDFFMGEGRGSRTFWFENRGKAGWVDHLVSDSSDSDVGAVALDIDGDGWMDKVAGGFWFRNTGHPRDTTFIPCKDGASEYVHDMLAGDIDGDGISDIINIDYDGIRWFTVPKDSRCIPWIPHQVNGYTLNPQQHGGIAIGDIDGDGDLDISRVDRWFENASGKGLVWVEHVNLDFGQEGGWGLSGKARIVDIDGDGALDILQMECDYENGRVAWFKNLDGKGLKWERHIIKDSTDGQDFHTLVLADFDGDGDQDIFSMGGPSTRENPKAYLWEKLSGSGLEWEEHILLEGRQGHEGEAFDIDGDGDQDILLKPFARGGIFYFENLLYNSTSVKPILSNPGISSLRLDPKTHRPLLWIGYHTGFDRLFNAQGQVLAP